MRFTLALATLGRHRGRTVLAILGVAVASAMLLDMVMLSSGLRASFRDLLLSRDFNCGFPRRERSPSIPTPR
ncbi:MAG: hypothetical protein ACRENC_19690, partial [Gemmatimonadaceae bacterium]